jgi:aspartyl protease family protein
MRNHLHHSLIRHVSLLLIAMTCSIALAQDVGVVGLFPGKAVLVVSNTAPKTYSISSKFGDGAKLIAVDHASATVNGKSQVLQIGQHHIAHKPNGSRPKATLHADDRRHFVTDVQINGHSMRMRVDTGTTLISMPSTEAMRLGIDYRKGQPGFANTANGDVMVYKVRFDSVKVGDIELSQVDALAQESGLSNGLLGMSFLQRTEMQNSGGQMTLTKRF